MKTYKSNIDKISLVREKSDFKKIKISTSNDAAKYALQFYHNDLDIYESVFLILLNARANTIGYAKISQGGIIGTIVDKVIVLKYAIESLATSIILVHNHPTGNNNPSKNDRILTKEINNVCKMLNISFLDHIILSSAKKYYSFADNNEI